MINQILCTIFMTIPAVFQALAMEQMLIAKDSKVTKWQRILIWVVLFSIGTGFKSFMNDYGITKNFTGTYGIISFVVFLPLFYKDSVWKKWFVMIAMILGVSLSEIGLLPAVKSAGIESMTDWDYTKTKIMIITGLSAVLSVIGIWLVLIIWKIIFREGKTTKLMWVFCIYAASQLLTFFFIPEYLNAGEMNHFVYISIVFSFLCTTGVLFVAFSQSEKEYLQDILNEETQRIQLEKVHFQEVENRRNELDEIVQKNSQFLKKAVKILESGSEKEAEGELMKQLKRLEMTKEYPYCGIPIINVILTEKQKECESAEINLEIDITLHEDLPINAIDLCRAISNILDNAIRACKQLEQKNPVIILKIGKVREYLVVRCENPYNKEREKFSEGTGQGLRILHDIAEKYQGYFQKNEDADEFVVQMNLKVPEEEKRNESSSM